MKKNFIALAVLSAFAVSAFATGTGQSVVTSGVNSGSISNTTKASATVVGVGVSVSGATGAASSSASATFGGVAVNTNVNCVTTVGGLAAISGATSTSVSGTAFNYSSGVGATGSASSVGGAVAHADGHAKYTAPGQSLKLDGSSDSASAGSVVATRNQAGAFSAAADGTFAAIGNVGSIVTHEKTNVGCGVSCGKVVSTTITGEVSDVKTSNASVVNSTLTVTGLPAGTTLGNATITGNANSVTVVNGSFSDPK